jgi:hypothetical protein
MFLRTFFSKNDDFVRETKIVPWEKKYSEGETRSEESNNTSNVGATTWVKEDKTPNLGPFTGNPGMKHSIWPNKSVINNRTFFRDYYFQMLCKETNLYYFQNQGKYASSSKGLNGWMSGWQNWIKNCNNFATVPLHKEECFERYHSLNHYKEPWKVFPKNFSS